MSLSSQGVTARCCVSSMYCREGWSRRSLDETVTVQSWSCDCAVSAQRSLQCTESPLTEEKSGSHSGRQLCFGQAKPQRPG